jgi:hypothetical protein
MTSHERAQRNVGIIEARARGLSWPRIAHLHGQIAERLVAVFAHTAIAESVKAQILDAIDPRRPAPELEGAPQLNGQGLP